MDLRDLFFPRSCLQCGKAGKYLCEQCLHKVPIWRPTCSACNNWSPGGKTHYICKQDTPIDGLMSMWKYSGVVRKGIISMKYHFAFDVCNEFVEAISGQGLQKIEKSILIPVPLHKRRENWRGFNQSTLLASQLSEKLSIPCVLSAVIRIENTIPQAQLRHQERLQNMRGKFAVNNDKLPLLLEYKTIILVDDVWTTGSTMKEIAYELKKRGVMEIWGFTLAG